MASEERERVVTDLWSLPATRDLTLEEWRHGAAAGERLPLPDGFRHEAVDAGGVEAQWAWWDDAGTDGPVILFFHGGGWVVCSIGTHRVLGGRLAREVGGRSLVVGYRLAPEHPFPGPVHDCAAAYRWLLGQGLDPGRVVLAGDSAGGNLVVAVALALKSEGTPLPAALVAISPAPDLTFRGRSNVANRATDPFSRIDDMDRIVDCYLQGHDPTDPLASPVFGDLSGLPPLLVMVGPTETLRDDSEELARVAAAAGVDTTFELVDGAFHTWLDYGGLVPEADRSIERIGRFVSLHTASRSGGPPRTAPAPSASRRPRPTGTG